MEGQAQREIQITEKLKGLYSKEFLVPLSCSMSLSRRATRPTARSPYFAGTMSSSTSSCSLLAFLLDDISLLCIQASSFIRNLSW
jgi:hypothetical protein